MLWFISIASSIVGFSIGSVIGYCTGKVDGADEAARFYERKRAK